MKLTKICIYLTSIILASIPSLVKASPQIAPNPNYSTITVASPAENSEDFYNQGVLSIDASGTLVNNLNSILRNYGDLRNFGSLSNFGYLYNSALGTLNVYDDSTVNNNVSGIIDNYGETTVIGASINNWGALNNSGTLDASFGDIENFGTLNNSGSIKSFMGGSFNSGVLNNSGSLDLAASGINNSGTLDNSGGMSLTDSALVNSATLINSGSMDFDFLSQSGGRLDNYDKVINRGTLSFDNYSHMDNRGTLINSGTLNNTGSLSNFDNLSNSGHLRIGYFDYLDSTLDNSGDLYNSALGTLSVYGTVNNSPGGTLDNFGYLSINMGNIQNAGVLNNSGSSGGIYGTITNYGDLNNAGSLDLAMSEITNSGSLNNSGGMRLGDIYLVNSATLINSGWMNFYVADSGGSLENNNRVNNRGTMSFDYNNYLFNDGALINSGTLNIDTDWGRSWNKGILDNSGSLNNTGQLENEGALINSGVLNNAGMIVGSGTYTQSAGETINNGSLSQQFIQIFGGSLSGTGTITGDVLIGSGASINPGNSPGTLTINGDFHSSGDFVFEIAGLNSGPYDVLDINGSAFFAGGNIEFNFIDGFHASADNHWDFLFADTINGWNSLQHTFSGLDTGLSIRLDGFSDHLSITVVAVPEPETYAMLLAGLGLLGFAARRRKESAV